jgi:hypothetical protein
MGGFDQAYLTLLVKKLRVWRVEFAPGLSDEEVSRVEDRYGFGFPPDLRMFLQLALPVSQSWVDWREAPEAQIRERLEEPLKGILFDIEHSGFWCCCWGARPAELSTAFEVAREHVERAPTLIPIVSHRYIPEEPHLAGNPVFSVHQTDIIHYGADLASYFPAEFSVTAPEVLPEYSIPRPSWAARKPRSIRFWDSLIR